MAITLGKNATLTVGGSISSVRNISWSASARTIDVEPFGQRRSAVYTTGYEYAVSFEFNDSADLDGSLLFEGDPINVSGGAGGWSFLGVITSINENDPIDGVATFSVEARGTMAGLRS